MITADLTDPFVVMNIDADLSYTDAVRLIPKERAIIVVGNQLLQMKSSMEVFDSFYLEKRDHLVI